MGLILIADDNPHAHRMGRQILSQEGHDVVTVATGDEAMEYLNENRPHLILVDTRMPGPSGYDICRHVKNHGELNTIKVILLAGPLEPFDSDQASDCGSDGVLHKPLDAFTLIDTVNSLIGKPAPPVEEPSDAPNVAAEHDEETAPEPPREAPHDLDDIQAGLTVGGSEAPASPEELAAAQDAAAQTMAALAEMEPETEPAPHEPEATAEEREAPQAAAREQPDEYSGDDPFADLVREALSPAEYKARRREAVRTAVAEVLNASIPTLIDTLTERVVERLDASND